MLSVFGAALGSLSSNSIVDEAASVSETVWLSDKERGAERACGGIIERGREDKRGVG